MWLALSDKPYGSDILARTCYSIFLTDDKEGGRWKKWPVRRLGTMAGTDRIIGDIVGPIGDESDWEAAKE